MIGYFFHFIPHRKLAIIYIGLACLGTYSFPADQRSLCQWFLFIIMAGPNASPGCLRGVFLEAELPLVQTRSQ